MAGFLNGFFGGGGGLVLVPVFTQLCGLSRKEALATALSVTLPLCLLSLLVYAQAGQVQWLTALPYAIGGMLGGFLGGRCFSALPQVYLKRGFALLLLFGGWRAVFG